MTSEDWKCVGHDLCMKNIEQATDVKMDKLKNLVVKEIAELMKGMKEEFFEAVKPRFERLEVSNSDHENRIREMEQRQWKMVGLLTVVLVISQIVAGAVTSAIVGIVIKSVLKVAVP